MFPIPEQDIETWRSKIAVDSTAAIALSSAMAHTLLESLSDDDNQGQNNRPPPCPQGVEVAILSIASDLQTILEEAMRTATTIFPQKPAAPKKGTLPQHLWPKSVRRDVDNNRRRVNPPPRRLASLATRHSENATSDTFPHNAL